MKSLQRIKTMPVLGALLYSGYSRIQRIKRHLDNIKRVKNLIIPEGKKVYYLDIPIHSNLGDIAQYLCAHKWIEENYPDYTLIEIDGYIISDLKCGMLEKIASNATKNDIIFFQSGYCTQDLGGYHDLVHKEVLKSCHDTPVIMLPQTVLYRNKKNAEEATRIYEQHGKVFFLARDCVSEKMAKELFPYLHVEAFPDIVTTLIGSYPLTKRKEGVIFCIRNDSEKYYSDDDIAGLIQNVSKFAKASVLDTSINDRFDDIKNQLDTLVNDVIAKLQSAKVVITDRYHGTIFSLVAGTPVIVIQSTDHKVKTGVTWFDGIYDDYVYFARSLEEAENLALQMLKSDVHHELKPYFYDNYYRELKKKIDKWLAQYNK